MEPGKDSCLSRVGGAGEPGLVGGKIWAGSWDGLVLTKALAASGVVSGAPAWATACSLLMMSLKSMVPGRKSACCTLPGVRACRAVASF